MATVNKSNVCSICNKPSIKYFCIGCKQHFCPKDFKGHEQQLSIKFDNEIVRSHDELLDQIQKLEKSNDFSSDLFTQIEEWKKTTINKIEKAAEKAHHELIELIHKQRIKITKQLEIMTKEIRYRREENFLENDIVRLKQNLNKIQETLQQLFRKDTKKAIIVDNDQIDWNRLIYIREEQQNFGGYSANRYGSSAINDRLRAVAARYEINDTLTQHLNILQQFKIVVLCDDSDSMNTLVDGTTDTRWDELRSIVRIVIEIGTVLDSNGIDVHFLNRSSMPNVTDTQQVVESFSQRPAGVTPLTPVLRRIFQSTASKPTSDKRLLVIVVTDGAPTDPNGNVDVQSLENLMCNERQGNTTYVTFVCTDDESSTAYLSKWHLTMMNFNVVDNYTTERVTVRHSRGYKYPFSFGDYVAKALLTAVGL
ncbi:unnamed protein product [Rotaria sp. Silwood2]|nr:unnamed protein product [Rotaria sp. Silwood2]